MNQAKLLASAEFAYNNSRSSSTKITLFKVLYDYNPKVRINITSTKDVTTKGGVLATQDYILQLYELQEYLREQLFLSQERQAKYYNQRH